MLAVDYGVKVSLGPVLSCPGGWNWQERVSWLGEGGFWPVAAAGRGCFGRGWRARPRSELGVATVATCGSGGGLSARMRATACAALAFCEDGWVTAVVYARVGEQLTPTLARYASNRGPER
jgi:hypothetical protein